MEKVKEEVRDFLSDKKNIENVIKRNHERSLANRGIKNPEKIGMILVIGDYILTVLKQVLQKMVHLLVPQLQQQFYHAYVVLKLKILLL